MKKYTLVFATLCACIAISCNKEVSIDKPNQEEVIETPTVTMKTVTISATIEDDLDDATKTSYSNTGVFSWTAGDKISVLCTDGNFYEFSANSDGSTSKFTGSIPDGYALGTKAYFPAEAGHTSSNFSLLSYKDISSHDSAEIPMLGTKGSGDVYSFVHCAGAALLTIENIPDGVTSATITVESYNSGDASQCVKLSGSFYIHGSATLEPFWDGAYAATASEKQFSRKVTVSSNTAKVYIPCAGGYNNWVPNKLTVTGHTSGGDVDLLTEKSMKKLGTVARAHILPLTPLVLNNLTRVNWSLGGIATKTLDDWQTATVGLTELKATSDAYYMYIRVKGPASAITSDNYLDVVLADGVGSESVWGDYWNTTCTTKYYKEHKGPVTTTTFTMKFNDINVETDLQASGSDIYWFVSLPRSAHSLLTSGTVYVGMGLWQGWSIVGCIPSKRTWDHTSEMMPVSLL